ncbi:MAG: chain length determinant protein EpsF [Burkholderiales bacterium]|nr:chain length determinant protein EpsF [Burkholderiales bacterium]
MSPLQVFRAIWSKKWLVLLIAVIVAVIGTAVTLKLPKQFIAEASMIVDVRVDPIMGALAPGLASPAYMATQVEVLKSDRVASRVVKMLGVERSPEAVRQWRESTEAKVPLERYFAGLLQRGLTVEPAHGSNVISISFASQDAAFAASAANAFAQAYMDVSVELRIEPARQSAVFLDEQVKLLRTNLEAAQAKLSKFQQDKGIIVNDERLDQENARLGTLLAQLGTAEGESVEAQTRQRNTGGDTSPDVMSNAAVQGLKAQLSLAVTKLSELSSIVGKNHPTRVQLEAQIAELKQQIASEIRRVSGGSSVVARGTGQKIAELRNLVEQQKKQVLSLRSQKDQVSVLLRDVETAQRAYEGVSQRVSLLNLEGQNMQANTRLLSQAVEPLYPARPRVFVNIIGSIVGGLLLGIGVALLWEMLDRRVRGPQDLLATAGVPVIGVLRPGDSKRPIFRQLTSGQRLAKPMLNAPGAR